MLITAGDLIESNSLQYKITDKEYKEYDCLYMKSVLECSGIATIVTESNFKGNNSNLSQISIFSFKVT